MTLLDPEETRARNPALRGELLGALHCSHDAVVEPRQVLPALRAHLAGAAGYTFLPGRVATHVAPGRVDDHTGVTHEGDLVVVCPGAVHDGVGRRGARRGAAPSVPAADAPDRAAR